MRAHTAERAHVADHLPPLTQGTEHKPNAQCLFSFYSLQHKHRDKKKKSY